MCESRAVGGRGTGQRGGMRNNRARSGFGLADLANDDWFARVERLFRHALKFLRCLYSFYEQQEYIGRAFIEHVVNEI
jgi:hypothetical protein